jgi:hypothetical protein
MRLAANTTLGISPPRAFLIVAILFMFTLSLVIQNSTFALQMNGFPRLY